MKTGGSFSFSVNISKRLLLLTTFFKGFLLVSVLLRLLFYIWQYNEVSWNVIDIVRTIATGVFFDVGTVSYILYPAVLYIFFMPNRFIGSLADKILVYTFFTLTVVILVFTFFAEITFWEEFRTRFNFIAVDYLIYTYEVVNNIRQSYPLPLLIGGVVAITSGIVYFFSKRGIFKATFSNTISFKQRMVVFISCIIVMLFYGFFVENNDAEWSANRYNNEISKAGIYSFFAEFRNNQIKYPQFYSSIEKDKAFKIVRNKLTEKNSHYIADNNTIKREIVSDSGTIAKPNVIFILMESMSASFMKEFGNDKNITPYMDDLVQNSILFSNLYATGTRTVRGMEAVTLCIPPTPGQSIVKRPDNHNLFTISTVFKNKGYERNFFYGGDGYFDNMNSYFGGNGFTIYDRGRGSVLNDDIKTQRHIIKDNEVTFENAWGVCDEDIYNKMLKVADIQYKQGKPFLNFVMSTSNHRPYTYPDNKIDVPSGTGREGAVKYADFALGKMLEKAATKPWFKNTVFVIVADHCASSAGKDEIDIANYHIPAIIYNLKSIPNQKIKKQCSQIDIFPTLFSMLHWDYESNFFGKNVLLPDYNPRALVGTYRKLALMKNDDVLILSDQKKQNFYSYDITNNHLTAKPMNKAFLNEAISWYETADYEFTNHLLKE